MTHTVERADDRHPEPDSRWASAGDEPIYATRQGNAIDVGPVKNEFPPTTSSQDKGGQRTGNVVRPV